MLQNEYSKKKLKSYYSKDQNKSDFYKETLYKGITN